MKTAIVTDSNCGITKKEADSLGIFMIPMPVCMNDALYYEGIDLEQKTFFEHLANHNKIHTSQPSPSDLNIKPLLTIGENKVDAYERVRG